MPADRNNSGFSASEIPETLELSANILADLPPDNYLDPRRIAVEFLTVDQLTMEHVRLFARARRPLPVEWVRHILDTRPGV